MAGRGILPSAGMLKNGYAVIRGAVIALTSLNAFNANSLLSPSDPKTSLTLVTP